MAVAAAGTAVATSAAIFASSQQIVSATHSASNSNAGVSIASTYVLNFTGASLQRCHPVMKKMAKISGSVRAVAPVAASPVEENDGYKLPTWAEFDLARAPIHWKTINGLPPTAGEKLKLFYNPAANKFVPNEDFEIAFNGGFNQHIMCGGEPRAMLPQFTLSRYASPSMLSGMVHTDCNFKFQVQGEIDLSPFLTEGLAEELSQEGAGF